MQTEYLPQPLFYRVWRICETELSEIAQKRLHAVQRLEIARKRGVRVQTACELIGIPRATLSRWERAFREGGPRALEPTSRRPKQVRVRLWTIEQLTYLKKLRHQFPVWGKKKLVRLMHKAGHMLSESSVGRMLTLLVNRGQIRPAHQVAHSYRKNRRKALRSWAKRLLKGKRLKGKKPGQAVQLDHMTVRPAPGVEQKHFNAHCTVSKWNVAGVYHRATARSAAKFLDKLIAEAPFPITGIQIDGGSEFMAEFEDACEEKSIALFVLAPKSPELNGGVERCNKTWRDEFYDLYDDLPYKLEFLRPEVNEQQIVMNYIRPHEALDQLTPVEYLKSNYPEWTPSSHM